MIQMVTIFQSLEFAPRKPMSTTSSWVKHPKLRPPKERKSRYEAELYVILCFIYSQP